MNPYHRPAWIEIDLAQLQTNWEQINRDKPPALQLLAVVKDQAYGHGAVECARVALRNGVRRLAVATLSEAVELRENGITAPILVFGERLENQFDLCLRHDLTIFINSANKAKIYAKRARQLTKIPRVHIEIDTGLARYGIPWNEAVASIESILAVDGLQVEGLMSHFAMSDELDKSYAYEQLARFQRVLDALRRKELSFPLLHMCNSGGFLDLPAAHFDMVRLGILPLGVFPSQVCRRIPGIRPIMHVKAKIVTTRNLKRGGKIGYGMHYTAPSPRRIAVLPLGYGDGFPRVRNAGYVLMHGRQAPIIGGNAMDATMVDITDIPQAQIGDDVVIMGSMGDQTISVHQVAHLKGSVSYDILTNWRGRLPRIYI
jgi:alanine racemase